MKKEPIELEQSWNTETKLVRGGRLTSDAGETSEALFLNSSYSYDTAEEGEARFNGVGDGFKYGRYSHPNLAMLETRLALMEEAEACVVTASGMAALFAVLMCQLKSGDNVVASRVLFSSCHYIITQILPRFGISYTLVDSIDMPAWEAAITDNTRCVFIETPANPTLELVDIAAISAICKKIGSQLIIDNVFATPLLQHPLKLGADVVMYSTTKHIDGQGRTLGGAILGSKKFIEETVLPFVRHTGPHMSPFTAWTLLKSLETLHIRVERHCENAAKIVTALEGHPAISKLIYPSLPSHPQYEIYKKQMSHGGAMVCFELKGGKEAAFAFMNALKIIDISNNLGNSKSLITHPASTTHSSIGAEERAKIGISDSLLRLSVGIEHIDDLKNDILQALAAL